MLLSIDFRELLGGVANIGFFGLSLYFFYQSNVIEVYTKMNVVAF